MKMYFPAKVTPKTLLFFTILVGGDDRNSESKNLALNNILLDDVVFTPWAISFVGAAGGRTLNVRIGFDLMQGKNGAPSLRIRDFQGPSDLNPRAAENEDPIESPTVIRADSFSDSKEKQEKQDDSSKAESQSNSDDDDDDGSGKDAFNIRSTRGLRPGEYEPEENARVHGRYEEDENESDGARRRRQKRAADSYGPSKRKGKKVRGIRKQVSTGMEQSA